MTTRNRQGTSTTALKALRALEVVADSGGEISSQEVADHLCIHKVTAYRMLITLEAAGYVVRNPHTNRFSLTYKLVSLTRNLLAENVVSKLITATLRELVGATGETMHYSVLDANDAVLVQVIKGSQLVNATFQIGDRAPLHRTSIGKVLLAYQDVRFIDRLIEAVMPRYASNPIREPDKLRLELEQIRARGYALDNHELADNMRCIAVPIFQGGGRVRSGISISGPASRFSPEYLEMLREPMLAAARDVSRRLGGIPWSA